MGYLKPYLDTKQQRQRTFKTPENNQKFAQKYPQAINQNDCVTSFGAMLMNWTQGPYDVMTMYGTFMINDLGSYQACQALDVADWIVISLNISHSPITLNLGACLP